LSGIKLIVGLGNPGADYAETRHNAGAWFVLQLARTLKITLRHDKTYPGFHSDAEQNGHRFHLFIPATFMNVSGTSVNTYAKYYKILPEDILVAHDEIDIPVGDIRLKFDGGHGGHNGLRDIIQCMGTNKFHRLRIGVGRPLRSKDVVDYVLKPPKKTEREKIDSALQNAFCILPDLLKGEFQKAMHTLHTKEA